MKFAFQFVGAIAVGLYSAYAGIPMPFCFLFGAVWIGLVAVIYADSKV